MKDLTFLADFLKLLHQMFASETLIVMIKRLEKQEKEPRVGGREVTKPPFWVQSSSPRHVPLEFATKVPVFI